MSKLLKLTLEFEDETKILEGAQAQRWLEAANSAAIMNQVHGGSFPQFNWRITKRKIHQYKIITKKEAGLDVLGDGWEIKKCISCDRLKMRTL